MEITEGLIKDFCKSKKGELISYKDNGDSTVTINASIDIRITYHELDFFNQINNIKLSSIQIKKDDGTSFPAYV